MTALIIGPDEIKALALVRARAETSPIDVRLLMKQLDTEAGHQAHRSRMTEQTAVLANPSSQWKVTYSIEWGHPTSGMFRHLSVSLDGGHKWPSPEAVWMLAQHFGFLESIDACDRWPEGLHGGGHAVNIIQPVPN